MLVKNNNKGRVEWQMKILRTLRPEDLKGCREKMIFCLLKGEAGVKSVIIYFLS